MGVNLNRKLVLEENQYQSDSLGGFTNSWIILGELWGEISLRGAQTRDLETGDVSQVRLRIVVRSAPVGSPMRPAPHQRFKEGTRCYVIDAVTEHDAFGMYLECWAHEEVAS
ncbi:hypothetical protein GCM10007939_03370 [Amylibacter marinus]|uniref:Head-tail adaptor n=1 Tax=Amylibacter marinus TaxID=1475483 RepID=A0ABQ5VSC7_9RHOB|nr:head-tail adaptor protein [Amylibacter marinus]GLQ34054.1 hypothetical protein GCM10007939_03370 [Amylibacter marinus]